MMSKKYKYGLIAIIIVLALKGGWHYLTVTAITYGPFEIQIMTPEPMEDIVVTLTYNTAPNHGVDDDYYYKVRVVKSGEWVTFPAGKFQLGGKPSMLVTLYHPELLTKTRSLFGTSPSKAKKQWDGNGIKFPPLKVKHWQGEEVSAHLMSMNRSYLKHFSGDERKKLHKYAAFLEQRIDYRDSIFKNKKMQNALDTLINERSIKSARYNLELFKAATQ
jgi:hypothetical protein